MSLDATLRHADKLTRAGRRTEARATLEALVAKFPANARARAALAALGAAPAAPPAAALAALGARLERGEAAAVLAEVAAALRRTPKSAPLLNLAGLALQQLGRNAEAEARFAAALKADPGLAIAAHNRAAALVALGRLEEAAEAALLTTRLAPGFAEGHLSAGFALFALGRLDEAKARFRAVAEAARAPGPKARACLGLGNLAKAQGQLAEALAHYREGLRLDPANPEIANTLAVVLDAEGDSAGALAVLDAGLARHPDHLSLLVTKAACLMHDDQPEAARDMAEAALARAPGHPRALLTLGLCQREAGETEAARESLARAAARAPDDIEIEIARADIDLPAPDSAAFARLDALANSPSLPAMERVRLGFVQFKALDRAGDRAAAFARLAEANALRARLQPYDRAADRAMFEALPEALPAPGVLSAPPVPENAPRPVFIVGMPRSGTSLVEQILASHSAVSPGGEMKDVSRALRAQGWDLHKTGTPFDAAALADIAGRVRAGLARVAKGRPVVTDKTPVNFRFAGVLLAALPDARVLWTRRDPVATCWSNYRLNFTGGGNRFGNDLGDLAAYYAMHERLMTQWEARYPDRVHRIDYEALTEDQEGQSRALVQAAGLDWEPACLEFHRSTRIVRTASNAQVRKPMYRGSSEAWRAYAPQLAPLLAALAAEGVTPAQ